MKAMVVLPTYNEMSNLKRMVESLLAQQSPLQILIVDDNSPDGTGKLADQLSQAYPDKVFVCHRPCKEGLGKAYLEGFRKALDLGADFVIQMDCDFSHPVSLIPSLLNSLETHDFALASRYISGGGTQNWGFMRKLISRGGNFYARWVLNTPIKDLTGGFKAFRKEVVAFLLNCPLDSSGYSFQIETTSFARAAGFQYHEIPFLFVDRVAGHSKMSKGIIVEAFLKTWNLRNKLKQVRQSSRKTLPIVSGVVLEQNHEIYSSDIA